MYHTQKILKGPDLMNDLQIRQNFPHQSPILIATVKLLKTCLQIHQNFPLPAFPEYSILVMYYKVIRLF